MIQRDKEELLLFLPSDRGGNRMRGLYSEAINKSEKYSVIIKT